MKKLLLLTILISGILMINSCSKKDVKIDDPQEETPTETQPEEKKPGNITFKTYPADEGRGVIELVSDTTTSKIYFYGNFDDEQEENLLVNAVTYQSPDGDSLYHFVLDGEHRVKRMYITFPDGSFDTTLLTLSYPHPDTTIVSSYYYNWETNENRLHFRTKTYYKNGKLTAHQSGRFSLSEFKDVSLKTVLGSVIAAVGVVEATGAIIALATTAPAWAIVGAGIAIVAFANSAMASDEMVLSETPFQGPISPAAHVIPNLPDASDEGGNGNTSAVDSVALYLASAEGLYKVVTEGNDLYCELGYEAKYTIYNDSHWPDGYTWKLGWVLRKKDGRYYILTSWTNPGYQIETAEPVSYPVTSFVYGNALYVKVDKKD